MILPVQERRRSPLRKLFGSIGGCLVAATAVVISVAVVVGAVIGILFLGSWAIRAGWSR